MTVLAGAALVWLVVTIADWAFLNAVWGAAEPARCREVNGGVLGGDRGAGQAHSLRALPVRGTLALDPRLPRHRGDHGSVLRARALGPQAAGALWLTGFGTFVLLMYGGVFGFG